MVNKRRGILFLIGFGLIILLLGNISAEYFEIVPAGDCTGSNIVMRLYDQTNSHGVISQITYGGYVLCANYTATKVCDGSNKILGLSGAYNAHAESTLSSFYTTDICYGNLECFGTADPGTYLSQYPITVISLTSSMNAHIGGYDDYNVKILCKNTCVLNSTCCDGGGYSKLGSCYSDNQCNELCSSPPANGGPYMYWMDHSAVSSIGEISVLSTEEVNVTMILQYSSMLAPQNFSVYEISEGIDPSGVDALIPPEFIVDSPVCPGESWYGGGGGGAVIAGLDCTESEIIATRLIMNQTLFNYLGIEDDELFEFYFEVNGNSSLGSGLLYVDVSEEVGEPNAYWMDGEGIVVLTDHNVSSSSFPHTYAMVIENSGLSQGNVTFEVSEDDTGEGFLNWDDEIKFVDGTVDANGKALAFLDLYLSDYEEADDDGDDIQYEDYPDDRTYEFFFEVGSIESGNLDLTFPESIIGCEAISLCGDYYSSGECTADGCEVAVLSLPDVNCSDPDISCNCAWNSFADSCYGVATYTYNGFSIGNCTRVENFSGDDCTDGFLSYSWIANWSWAGDNPTDTPPCNETWPLSQGECHYDPTNASGACVSGSNVIACPAQIQLSFFSTLNLIAAVILLGVVYYLLKRRSLKKVKKKSSKKVSKKKK
jgi:hypothetical protein